MIRTPTSPLRLPLPVRRWLLPLWAGALLLAGPVAQAQTSNLIFSTLAGSAGSINKSQDGVASAAEFYAPRGVSSDSAGNVYVADSSNNSIRKISPTGTVTTLAGLAGNTGRTDGSGTAARFSEPFSVATDAAGNLYVADTSNNLIRKISAAGVVTTLAGAGSQGSNDGTGTAAKFAEPRGVGVDAAGNVYVADYNNHKVRKITPAGVVTTLAGSGSPGNSDGTGSTAQFRGLISLAVSSDGTVYVADTGNRAVRKITPAGVVSTYAGGAGAPYGEIRGIAVSSSGTVYVSDFNKHAIYQLNSSGSATLLAGMSGTPGASDGSGTAARFYSPSNLHLDASGNLLVADTLNNTIRKISASGSVTTLAGLAGRSSSVDGSGSSARFEDPYAVAVDASGTAYVADATDHSIRKVTAAGVVTTLAGSASQLGSSDGSGAAARFFEPHGIAVDGAGNVFVADTGNNTVRKITAAGVVTTLAGTAGQSGSSDGTGAAARFSNPYGVSVDGSGNVYVSDASNNTIRKITAAGVVTTLAGSPGATGLTNGSGSAARFSVPFDLAADSAGNVYVCDHGNHVIRKVTPAGVVSTLAGSGSAGNSDGSGTAASFRWPSGVAVDSAGNVYVADTDNQAIRKITSAGVVTTLAGGAKGYADGSSSVARFANPKDVAVDGSGNLYVADRNNYVLRKGSAAATSSSNSSADCLFNWAERNFASLFAPATSSQTASPYYYRYYSSSQAYLAVSSADQHVYYYAAGRLQDAGPLSTWQSTAGCP